MTPQTLCGHSTAQTEPILIARARSGNPAAFEPLAARYRPRLIAFIQRSTGSREDAEDLTQETLLRAFRALPTFTGQCSFTTWVFTFARNLLVDRARARARVPRPLSLDEPMGPDTSEPHEIPDSRQEPRQECERGELRRVVGEAVAALDEGHRQVLLMQLQGLSYDEIAAVLGIPRGTVKSRIFHARAALGRKLKPYMAGVK